MFKNKTIENKECAIETNLYWIMRVTNNGNIVSPDDSGPVGYYLKDIFGALEEFQREYPRRKFIITQQCFIPITKDEILKEKRNNKIKKERKKESLKQKKTKIIDSIKNKLNPEELKYVKIK